MKDYEHIRSETFEMGDKTYSVDVQYSTTTDPYSKRRLGRAFVHGPGDSLPMDAVKSAASIVGAPDPYTIRGEYPDLDRAWDAYNKTIVALKRGVLNGALSALGWDEIKATFAKTAGCPCGCSPGFVLKGPKELTDNATLYVKEVK